MAVKRQNYIDKPTDGWNRDDCNKNYANPHIVWIRLAEKTELCKPTDCWDKDGCKRTELCKPTDCWDKDGCGETELPSYLPTHPHGRVPGMPKLRSAVNTELSNAPSFKLGVDQNMVFHTYCKEFCISDFCRHHAFIFHSAFTSSVLVKGKMMCVRISESDL